MCVDLLPKLDIGGTAGTGYQLDELTRNGALGDARIATPEYGKALVDSALDNFTAFVEELIANSPVG